MPDRPPRLSEAGTATASDRAARLIGLFYADAEEFGTVREIAESEVPQPVRGLLCHRGHMTVVMEAFVGGAVDLRVRREIAAVEGSYAREIILVASPGAVPWAGAAVQHGIVRIDLSLLPEAVAERIRRKQAPLGRVLIEAGMLRDVRDVAVLEIVVGEGLAAAVGKPAGTTLYGRVAAISLADATTANAASSPHPRNRVRPAIDLLEIPLV